MPFDGSAITGAPPASGGIQSNTTQFSPGQFSPSQPNAQQAGASQPGTALPARWQRVRLAFARLLQPTHLRRLDTPAGLAPTRESSQALQTLGLARSLIADERAWVQRRYETRDGRRCAVGALRGAARLLHSAVPHGEAVSSLLAVAMARGFTDIETMNDHSTHKQVVSAFDEAIMRVRQVAT